jgi:ATP/maltotriose-dependent transcriptional regulator MalT
VAGRARGAVLLAAGNSSGALGDLRTARATWGDLGLPFEEAQARLLIASAMKTLGDEDGAIREIRTARATFERLGADAEARLAVAMLTPSRPAGLTPRELEVLGLVAAGSSNRDIATALVISEHTVARHVQNLFAKLGVSSRAAATAFAVEHQLAQGRGQNQPGAHRLTW